MPTPTKIFISSVSQDAVTPLRDNAFAELLALGHDPQMFEKNFGPWPMNATGIQHCLNKVTECDIYCLFVHNNGGTMTESGQTVTHLEFLQAVKDNKILILYCEATIITRYFSQVRRVITGFVDDYRKKTSGKSPLFNEIIDHLELESEAKGSTIPSKHEVEIYVWVLLYDIVDIHGQYVEKLPWGGSILWKSYLSDILRQGTHLIPRSSAFMESIQIANAFSDFIEFAQMMVSDHLRISEFVAVERLLSRLVSALYGAEITHGPVNKEIGKTKSCSAVCLFHKDGDILKLISYAGDTDGNRDFHVTDQNSFVAFTYNNIGDDEPALFYDESKRMFYMTFKVQGFVISYHFPEASSWNQQLYLDYTDNITSGIINAHANGMVFEFINSIIRGLQK